MTNIMKYQGPTILWAFFILLMCAIKLGTYSNESLFFEGFDKLAHCGFFFVFAVFCCNGIIRQTKPRGFPFKYAVLVFLIAILYGYGIEILQKYIFIWREFDWNDVFADGIGTGMGVFSVLVISSAFKHDKK